MFRTNCRDQSKEFFVLTVKIRQQNQRRPPQNWDTFDPKRSVILVSIPFSEIYECNSYNSNW